MDDSENSLCMMGKCEGRINLGEKEPRCDKCGARYCQKCGLLLHRGTDCE